MPDEMTTVCVGCGRTCAPFVPTINLTVDTLFVEQQAWELMRPAPEVDVAFDWCGVDCFAWWLFRACAYMGATPRPDAITSG